MQQSTQKCCLLRFVGLLTSWAVQTKHAMVWSSVAVMRSSALVYASVLFSVCAVTKSGKKTVILEIVLFVFLPPSHVCGPF